MTRFYNDGTPANSFSPLTAAGTVGYAEVSEPYHRDIYVRYSGATTVSWLSMGLFLQYDAVEPKRGSGGFGSAGAAKSVLDGNSYPDCFGRQVVIADAEDTDVTSTNVAFKYFAGVFTGLVARETGGYGKNMPLNTVTATSPTTPTNGFTYKASSSAACIDPLNGGRSYCGPGDIIVSRISGPAIGWCSDTNSTVADSLLGFMSTVNTPQDGVAFLPATASNAVGVTFDAPAAFATAGTAQGCRIMVWGR